MSTIPDYEIKTPQLTAKEAEKAVDATVETLKSAGINAERVREEVINEWVFQAIAPHEKLWRHAKGASLDRFYQHATANAKDTVRAALAVLADAKWPTLDECIPPNSILHDIDVMVFAGTNFPRELPFFNVLHYVSAMLLQNGTIIEPPSHMEARSIYPDLWSVALAESGSGKSATQSVIAEIMGDTVRTLPDPSSSAMYVELLSKHNGALWARDEFGQFLAKLGVAPWADGKDYLLRTCDHSTIEYNTKTAGCVTIEKAKLTLFGASVPGTFRSQLSLASLTDGFAQRLTYIFATPDGRKRPPLPTFPGRAEITTRWAKIRSQMRIHSVYRVDDVAWNAYVQAFDMIMERSGSESIPESFSGRLVVLAFKYAAIFHVLLGKTDDVLHAEDMIYAARVVALNLRDLRKLLDLYEVTAFGSIAEKAKEKVLANAKKKKQTAARDLQQGVRGFDSIEQAWQMVEYLADDPECKPHLDMEPPRSLRGKGFTGKSVLTKR